MGTLSADVAALLRELPARVQKLEAAVATKVTAAEAVVTPDTVDKFLSDLQTRVNSWENKVGEYLDELKAANIPARLQAAEAKISQIVAKLPAAPVTAATPAPAHGSLAQQTAPPAATKPTT